MNQNIDIGILTVIRAELESTLKALGMSNKHIMRESDETIYYVKDIESKLNNRKIRVALSCIGDAGNVKSGIATESFIKDFSPKIMVLVGIAAGIKKKVKIGDVILAERVVAYERASIEKYKGKEIIIPRPDIPEITHPIRQLIVNYFPNDSKLLTLFNKIGGTFPSITDEKLKILYDGHIATKINVITSTIASGEKLLKNPDKLKWLQRNTHGKIESGEMEAAGFSAACDKHKIDWLIIRGISDFGDKKKNDDFHIFASFTASTVLADLIKNAFNIDYKKKDSAIWKKQDYLKNFSNKVQLTLSQENPNFDLKASIASSYENLINRIFEKDSLNPRQFLQQLNSKRLILINASGGSGKTTFIYMVAQEAIKKEIPIFLLDFKTGKGTEKLAEINKIGIEQLFSDFSIVGKISDFNNALENEGQIILLIDGLNEVYSELSDIALQIFEKLSQNHANLQIIIADRMNHRPKMNCFRGTLLPLTKSEISKHVENQSILDDEKAVHLLSIPFFLDLQLKLINNQNQLSVSPNSIRTREEMFERYFREVGKVNDEEFAILSKTAFEAYKKFYGRTIEVKWWIDVLPLKLRKALDEAGITIQEKNRNGKIFALFRHHLLHDFLVGYYLAEINENDWRESNFDIATFNTNSIEPLSFATEILVNIDNKANDFLVQVFDWSYRSVNRCIKDLKNFLSDSSISYELEFALTAKNAEKMFDVFEDTISGAKKRLEDSTIQEKENFLNAKNIDEVIDIVKLFKPQSERFKHWKELFTLPNETNISDRQLSLLDDDPIIGWTAANTFRRVCLSTPNLEKVRFLVDYSLTKNNSVLRWRIVHLLGKYPSTENIELLIDSLNNDLNDWVKYGALRSLMEIASRPENKFRDKIIFSLTTYLDNQISPLTIRELRRTCLVKDAKSDWYSAIKPLSEKAANLPEGKLEENEWEIVLKTIEERRKSLA